tara:strand:- start:1375 stop:1533 length:159 start_codon:yes stop_codon:yes gene_type:complete
VRDTVRQGDVDQQPSPILLHRISDIHASIRYPAGENPIDELSEQIADAPLAP